MREEDIVGRGSMLRDGWRLGAVALALAAFVLAPVACGGSAASSGRPWVHGQTGPASASTSRWAYTCDSGGRSLSRIALDPTTGLPTGQHVTLLDVPQHPAWAAVDPVDDLLYVIEFDSRRRGSVESLRIDRNTGELTRTGAMGCGRSPDHIVVHPSGGLIFVCNPRSGDINVVRVDPSTGALRQGATPTVTASAHPNSLAVDRTGRLLYATDSWNDEMRVFSVDAATGSIALAGGPFPTDPGPDLMTMHPTLSLGYLVCAGSMTVTGDVQVLALDPATGSPTTIARTSAGDSPQALAFVSTSGGDFAYVVNMNSNDVSMFSADKSGLLTPIGTARVGYGPTDIVADPSGHALYVTNYMSNSVSTFSIDPRTGSLTPAQEEPAGAGVWAIVVTR